MANPLPDPLCPSSQPVMEDVRVIGLLSGTKDSPTVAYLPPTVDIGKESLPDIAGLEMGEVFRLAAKCDGSRCAHFDGNKCSLGKRIVDRMPAVVDVLPNCGIRNSCRWFSEQGRAACLRCPQIITMVPDRNEPLNPIADSGKG